MTLAAIADAEQQSEVTYRAIRSDILFGRLPPGSKLKLERLRGDYGTSISTLREILSRLSSERFVVAEGQRGFQVAPISPIDLQESAELRLLLETHALAASFARGDLDWESRVVAAHHKLTVMERRLSDGDTSALAAWKQYDWQFHQSLISACGSSLLMRTHATAFDRYLRYQMIALGYRGDIAIEEHCHLRDSALARNAPKAAEILDRHVRGGVAHALAMGAIG